MREGLDDLNRHGGEIVPAVVLQGQKVSQGEGGEGMGEWPGVVGGGPFDLSEGDILPLRGIAYAELVLGLLELGCEIAQRPPILQVKWDGDTIVWFHLTSGRAITGQGSGFIDGLRTPQEYLDVVKEAMK